MPESKLEKSSLEPLAAGPQHGDKASEATKKEEEKVEFQKIKIRLSQISNSRLSALCRHLFPLYYIRHAVLPNPCNYIAVGP